MLVLKGELGLVMIMNMFLPLGGHMAHLAFATVATLVEVVDLMT